MRLEGLYPKPRVYKINDEWRVWYVSNGKVFYQRYRTWEQAFGVALYLVRESGP